jgi:hypothetical protein
MIILKTVNKSERRNEYHFEKTLNTIKCLEKFLGDLKIKDAIICLQGLMNSEERIEDISDVTYGYENEEYTVEIIFGKERIIVIIRSKTDKQDELSRRVFKFADFEHGN